MKRLMALLMCLVLVFGASALGEGTIASYELPGGADVRYISDAGEFAVPEGLEPMYELMQSVSLYGDIYLMRMKNGRVLVSVSCIPTDTPKTAEELHALWPQIAQAILLEADEVNADESCAAVEHLYGRDLLHIRTQLVKGGVPVEAEAFAFSRGGDMLEVWAVHPADSLYDANQQAAAELESDRADLALFLASLDFSGAPVQPFDGQIYQPSDGRYQIGLPEGAVVLTAQSDMTAVDQARTAFIAANEEGADNVFDQLMLDVMEQDCLLILTSDMKGAMQLFCSREESFAGATLEQLAALAQPITASLQERFGTALCLAADERAWIGGREHTLIGYWLRSGECDVQLDIAACVLGEDWLCELDIYTVGGDQELRAQLHTLMGQTLVYNVE